jgi:hypothetical protein
MIKLFCRITGEEIVKFHVLLENICHTREFISCGEGTIIEYDREYLDGSLGTIIYVTSDGVHHELQFSKDEVKNSLFLLGLINENKRFDITNEMINESIDKGPFLIKGSSRIVEIEQNN